MRNDSSHLLFVPGSLHAGDYVDARGNDDDVLDLLCTDRLEKSILFSQILMEELISRTKCPPTSAIDWDASAFVSQGVSTRWLRVPRSVRSPVVYSFFYSANCRHQYFDLLKQVENLHLKGNDFDPATDAVAPVAQIASSIKTACLRFFSQVGPSQNLSVRLGREVCEKFSPESFYVGINLRDRLLSLRQGSSTTITLSFQVHHSALASLPFGAYEVADIAGENLDEGISVEGQICPGFSRFIRLVHPSSGHVFVVTGGPSCSNSSIGSSNPVSVLVMSHRDVMILASIVRIGKIFQVSHGYFELNEAVVSQTLLLPTDGTFPYRWSSSEATGDGCTTDITYQDRVILKRTLNEAGAALTFCCGLTLERWIVALNSSDDGLVNMLGGRLAPDEMLFFKRLWFVDVPDMFGGALDALVRYGFGVKIQNLEESRPGDFIQFWRKSTDFCRSQKIALTSIFQVALVTLYCFLMSYVMVEKLLESDIGLPRAAPTASESATSSSKVIRTAPSFPRRFSSPEHSHSPLCACDNLLSLLNRASRLIGTSLELLDPSGKVGILHDCLWDQSLEANVIYGFCYFKSLNNLVGVVQLFLNGRKRVVRDHFSDCCVCLRIAELCPQVLGQQTVAKGRE